MKNIGILAIQGDFEKHANVVISLGHRAIEVRTLDELALTDALIIPGGESTTFVRIFNHFNMAESLVRYAKTHPVMGTCAGLIILSREADNLPFKTLNLIDITTKRNAYGRQKESFIDTIDLTLNGKVDQIEGVFIRAPKIDQVGENIEILARHKSDIVMVRSENILAATFHPELTNDKRIHKYFIDNFIQ